MNNPLLLTCSNGVNFILERGYCAIFLLVILSICLGTPRKLLPKFIFNYKNENLFTILTVTYADKVG